MELTPEFLKQLHRRLEPFASALTRGDTRSPLHILHHSFTSPYVVITADMPRWWCYSSRTRSTQRTAHSTHSTQPSNSSTATQHTRRPHSTRGTTQSAHTTQDNKFRSHICFVYGGYTVHCSCKVACVHFTAAPCERVVWCAVTRISCCEGYDAELLAYVNPTNEDEIKKLVSTVHIDACAWYSTRTEPRMTHDDAAGAPRARLAAHTTLSWLSPGRGSAWEWGPPGRVASRGGRPALGFCVGGQPPIHAAPGLPGWGGKGPIIAPHACAHAVGGPRGGFVWVHSFKVCQSKRSAMARALALIAVVASCILEHVTAGRRGAAMSTEGSFQTKIGRGGRGNRAGVYLNL